MSDDKILKINKKSFIVVCSVLSFIMILVYILTFCLPKGYYPTKDEILNDNAELIYRTIDGKGYSFLKFILSPILLLGSSDGLIVIVISLFIMILGGSFNVIDKTGGINNILSYLIKKFKSKKYLLIYIITLFFMMFGSLFGIFEESITLLPIIILLALAMGWDTFTGLSMCLLAAGFGFSTAITNPFSIGLGSASMGISITDGIWFRIIIFILMYFILCLFITLHVKKIEKNPESSPSYEQDQEKKMHITITSFENINLKCLRTYVTFFISVLIIIVSSSFIPFVKDNGLSIPLIAISFLIGVFICGVVLTKKFKLILKHFISGFISMSPSVIMLLLAGSIKFILDDSQIMATVIYGLTSMLDGCSPILGILFIYLIILLIQLFIGSASAKVILIIPIISMLADQIGLSKNLVLLAFVFGDGYTDLIYPTNPVLLISLGIASFSYVKWFKKTFPLQIFVLLITVLLLILGLYISY